MCHAGSASCPKAAGPVLQKMRAIATVIRNIVMLLSSFSDSIEHPGVGQLGLLSMEGVDATSADIFGLSSTHCAYSAALSRVRIDRRGFHARALWGVVRPLPRGNNV